MWNNFKTVSQAAPHLQPVGQRKTYADAILINIVVDQALAVSGKALDISFKVLVFAQPQLHFSHIPLRCDCTLLSRRCIFPLDQGELYISS